MPDPAAIVFIAVTSPRISKSIPVSFQTPPDASNRGSASSLGFRVTRPQRESGDGNLAFGFTEAKLTSYAGLELFDRYLRRIGFSDLIRTAFGTVRVLIGLLMVGGRHLEQLKYLATDPLLQRFARAPVWPTARTVSRWLKRYTMKSVEHLSA